MTPPAPTLESIGWSDRWLAHWSAIDDPTARPARVVRHDRGAVLIADGGEVRSLPSHVAGHAPVVGDWVAALPDRIHEVLPRHGTIRRSDPSGGEQVLAANVDVVLIVCGLDRPVKAGRIQRATVQAWDAGATPVVVLTKADLADDVDEVRAEIAEGSPGIEVVAVSSTTDLGVDELGRTLVDRTAVLVGESGAGKSTLVNALLGGDEHVATGRVRTGDAKGRHTTSHRELHVLATGGCLIDIPGVRSFGLTADTDAVDATFPEIDELAGRCRFQDCRHDTEPGCAVAEAVERGTLAPERLDAFRRLRREVESEALRAVEHERRAHEKSFARVAKEAQARKGRVRRPQ